MKIWKIAQEDKEDFYLYHGGYDLGDNPELKSGYKGGKPSGMDSGALFLTPSEKYARQYMKHPKGLYRTKLPVGERIFDIEDPDCHDQFIEGSINWLEDYPDAKTARKDAQEILRSMMASAEYGAVDWATASYYLDEMKLAGFTGAKFLERPAETIEELPSGGFKLSGPPVYSYALFKDKLPVERAI